MIGPFSGTTADYYARYRRGYPDAVVDALVCRLGLGPDDTVVDLGCGTGLLTIPIARKVRLVVGLDPEPNMLSAARGQTKADLAGKVVWALGSDNDLPALANLLGERRLAAVTIGQALHLMDYERLFVAARALLRPKGGMSVVANGVPIWQQDNDWSRSLRQALDTWFQRTSSATCGTDPTTQARYASALSSAGYEVDEFVMEYQAQLTFEQVVGNLYSAMSPDDVPEDRRQAFSEQIRRALPEQECFTETVPVHTLIGVLT